MRARLALALLSASIVTAQAGTLDPMAYDPYTPKGYPKTFRAWGKAGVAKINKYRKMAAEQVSKHQRCNRVELAELSDNRSNPPSRIVIFVDCANGERFYLTADQIDAGRLATSNSEVTSATSDSVAISACEKAVVDALKFPSSMDQKWFTTSVYRAPQGNVVVTFDFTAKNGLGLDLPQSARCVFDDRGMHHPEISNR